MIGFSTQGSPTRASCMGLISWVCMPVRLAASALVNNSSIRGWAKQMQDLSREARRKRVSHTGVDEQRGKAL